MKAKLSKHLLVLLLVVVLIAPASVAAQPAVTEEWVARYNGLANSTDMAVAVAVAVGGAGNVYVTGQSVASGIAPDYATVKYDSNGNQLWVAGYNGPAGSADQAQAIAVDGSGNVYVTGHSAGSGTGVDYATVKYDAGGTEQWVARYNGPANFVDMAYDIAVGGSGNVYVTGQSYGGSSTNFDYATVGYDSSGNQLWAARYNGPGNGADEARAIAVDASENIYVTGYSDGGSGAGADYATVKYDSNGNQLWVARYDGPADSTDVAEDIAVGGSGNVYVTGRSDGAGVTGVDYATVKYDADGNQLWAARYDGPANSSDPTSSVDGAWAIAVDGLENVYITGHSDGDGTGVDYATVKYDTGGNELWVARYNGPANSTDRGEAIAVDGSGNVYVTGRSDGIGTGVDYATVKYDSSGNELWVARYDGPGNSRDDAWAIAVDGLENVYVTGRSDGGGTGADYATIKYSQVSNVGPTVGPISAPVDPIEVNTEISASADFTDPDITDTHTAEWDWGDDSTSPGIVDEANGSGSVTGSHTYAAVGVYTVTLTVTDDGGESDQSVFQYIVVYDPSDGFVTGGGWIDSPEGAYTPDPSLTGRASFGFVSRYKNGAETPTGQTKFQFRVADLNFHSSSYQWLVVAGANAKYKGVGTINGGGNYGFMLTATDAALNPSTDVDLFRIKIWDRDDGDTVVYDNKMGSGDDSYDGTPIGGGNIRIHGE